MANRRLGEVSFRRFTVEPVLADGLLAVARDNGDLERRVAAGFVRMAEQFGQIADRQAERAGAMAGQQAALAGAPEGATWSGGATGGETGADGAVRVYSGSGEQQAMALLRHEEGFRDSPYWDKTAHRVGYGSDTTIGANGKPVRVTPGMKITRQQAEQDLTFRISSREGAVARRQLGETWGRLAPNVQAGLYSVAYNYGSLPKEVVAAARTGDVGQIASAVAGLSSNPKRRQREAALIRSGGMPRAEAAPAAPAAPAGDGTYEAFPSPASTDAPAVVPVHAPVEITRGKAGSFRPTGRDTVFGRAYDVAGTRTYLEMLDTSMMANQNAVYEAYKDDPAKLQQALQENLTADLRDNVFPEIEADYRVSYAKRAQGLVTKAQADLQERRRQENRVDFLNRVQGLEDEKSRQMAGLSLDDPNAASSLASTQDAIDAHYDSAVSRGILTPGEAAQAKRESRSDTTVSFYLTQAQKKNAGEIRTMHRDMTEAYAKGDLDGVTAADWARIDKGLTAAANARETQDDKANADLTKRGEDMAKRVARGMPVSPDELARFQLDAGTAPDGAKIVASTLSRLKVAEAIRTLPIGAVDKNLKDILGENATADDIAFARQAIASHRQDLATDPLGVAERFGVLPVSPGLPLEGDVDPASVSSAFAERINAARAAAKHFGVSPRYFRPGEAEQIETAVKADPEKGLSIAAGLVDAAGPHADEMLAQLGEVAPAVSLSGGLINAGGNRQAALDLIAGFGKTPDGKAYPEMANTKRKPLAETATGDALVFTPTAVNKLDQAAAAIARKRLYDAGIDPKDDEAKDVYRQAYQEAAGASFIGGVQYGGFTDYDPGFFWKERKVIVPASIRADRFDDLIGALDDQDVGAIKAKNGRTWAAKDFKSAMPVRVKGGYAFALNDPAGPSPMFIADADGKPVVLNLEGMRDRLAPRVPGAYR
ncbi:lysozyme [Rhizobium sp. PAMB 3182]